MTRLREHLAPFALELGLAVSAILLGLLVGNHLPLIPPRIAFVPHQPIAAEFFPSIFKIYLPIFALVLLLSARWLPANVFANARDTAKRLYSLAFALTSGALVHYLASQVPFNPSVLMVTAGFIVLLWSVSFLVAQVVSAGRVIPTLPKSLLALIASVVRLLARPAAIGILLFCTTPVLLMAAYVSNRNVSDAITRTRMFLTQRTDYGWILQDEVSGQLLPQPIDFRFDPVNDDTLYVLGRRGLILRVSRTAQFPAETLADFRDQVVHADVESGAMGIALHPDFGTGGSKTGWAFVYYTHFEMDPETEKEVQTNRLARFDLSLPTLEERSASQQILMDLGRRPNGSHNGGTVEFGSDGFLYVSIGESSTRESHGRIDTHLFGGVLRIDVDCRGEEVSGPIVKQPKDGLTQGYCIPHDNPFLDVEGALGEFWAMGLRNAYRFSFDPQTGDMWAGDVGTNDFEEVNIVTAGGNYQYPFIEGEEETGRPRPDQVVGREIGPIYYYRHTAHDRAIIGGVVYRSDRHPVLRDRYVFADNYSGKIFSIDVESPSREEAEEHARADMVAMRGISVIRESPEGRVVIGVLGHQRRATGRILRLVRAREASQTDAVELADTEEPIDGQTIFEDNCALCHGVDGRGKTVQAEELGVTLPDFSDPAFHESRAIADLEGPIRNGGGSLGLNDAMPAWGEVLSDEEIGAVIEYLRSLSR